MGYKNTSVTFKNGNVHKAAVQQSEHKGDRNFSAYIERLVRMDIQANGNTEVKKLIDSKNELA